MITGLNLQAVLAAATAYGASDPAAVTAYAGAIEGGLLEGQEELRKR